MGVSPLGKDHVWELNLAARAAWLSFVGDLTQSEIGKSLGVSSARVHRLILMAKEQGLVRVTIEGRPSECLDMEAKISERFRLRSCTISPYLRDESANEEVAIASVGQAAGQLLGQHLLGSDIKSIAVGMGRTMMAAITALPKVPRPDIQTYPVGGGLTEHLATNPYDVTSMFADRMDGKAYILPLPYFLPSEEERKFYLSKASVSAVLEAASKADLFVAGIASLSPTSHLVASQLLSQEQTKELSKLGVVGEFMGQFLNADGKNVDVSDAYSTIGVHLTDLKARTGTDKFRIFALAAGRSKTPTTLAALRAGSITDLVIDESLASELLGS